MAATRVAECRNGLGGVQALVVIQQHKATRRPNTTSPDSRCAIATDFGRDRGDCRRSHAESWEGHRRSVVQVVQVNLQWVIIGVSVPRQSFGTPPGLPMKLDSLFWRLQGAVKWIPPRAVIVLAKCLWCQEIVQSLPPCREARVCETCPLSFLGCVQHPCKTLKSLRRKHVPLEFRAVNRVPRQVSSNSTEWSRQQQSLKLRGPWTRMPQRAPACSSTQASKNGEEQIAFATTMHESLVSAVPLLAILF